MASVASFKAISDYLSPSELRSSRAREQAAAVCYRVSARGVEFLLVRTRNGRWTFPKGGVQPGLGYAQSAALEAFEEAGVHGRIEIAAFARYVRHKPSRSGNKSVTVVAHLCEVLRLAKPQERRRERTWFSAEKAKSRLHEGRTSENGAELAAVVDRAVVRVRRLHSTCETGELRSSSRNDALKKVCLEASATSTLLEKSAPTSIADFIQSRLRSVAAIEIALDAPLQRLHLSDAHERSRPILRLGSGNKPSANTALKLTTVDGMRGAAPRKNTDRAPTRPIAATPNPC